jgi:hypothetical protein
MKSKFLSNLNVTELRDGKWELTEDLIYQSKLVASTITVKTGFKTDFASVPRIPIVYSLFGDRAHHESVLHDWLYYIAPYPRKVCDKIFLEAMKCRGKSWFIRHSMYRGVRLGGWKAWNAHRKSNPPGNK